MSYKYDFGKRSKRSIGSIAKLLDVLDIKQEELDLVNSLTEDQKYKKNEIPKSDGTVRVVYNPHKTLRKVQRRINKRIFNQRHNKGGLISWPSYLYGSIPNTPQQNSTTKTFDLSKDYVACAANHCGSKSLLKMDISNFFDNIHETHVKNIFSNLLKFPEDVSNTLTSLCCLKGNVVQGALTSSYIASAVLFDVEAQVVRRLHFKSLTYTRLVDDITVSSQKLNYDFTFAQRLIADMLQSKDLPINLSKTIIFTCSTEELIVHGLRVNYSEPRLPSSEVARIRASVKHLELLAQDSVYRVSRDYRKSYDRCLGRVNKLGRLGHKQHSILLERTVKIKP
ncbi:MAG TPA: RNA-directed DNA polymerase, partial [Shewanella frigidimarina]|nr:RNA-directed DNA polymerase [Shewanella frigidimarina]